MITEKELLEAIEQYENTDNPTAQTCITLAAFYTVLDKMYPVEPRIEDQYSGDPDPAPQYSSPSEFGQAVTGKDHVAVLAVMDELMDAVQVLSPTLYAGVIDRLSGII